MRSSSIGLRSTGFRRSQHGPCQSPWLGQRTYRSTVRIAWTGARGTRFRIAVDGAALVPYEPNDRATRRAPRPNGPCGCTLNSEERAFPSSRSRSAFTFNSSRRSIFA